MKRLLIVVDMQNDFIDGVLGTPEAQAIIPNVVNKIKDWNGNIFYTFDNHKENYLSTQEGKNLPIEHCIIGENGWAIQSNVMSALMSVSKGIISGFGKESFGCPDLIKYIKQDKYDYIELVGVCTDICVISNALLLKSHFPEIEIAVDASCCAGTSPENHKAATAVMKSCQVTLI